MSIDEKIRLIDSLARVLHECNLKAGSKSREVHEETSEMLRSIISQINK